jgi:4-hydroxy-tetrahydrodipicolinate reductase
LSQEQPLRIAIAGALGRMGGAVAATAAGRPDVTIAARFDRPDVTDPSLVALETALAACDVVIDFSAPSASAALAAECAGHDDPPALVIGSTGFSAEQDEAIARASGRVAIVKAGNFSLGVNMLLGLVRQAAAALPARDWDIEVFEAHHKRKIDAPSGTALMLGRAAAQGRGSPLSEPVSPDRNGARTDGEIGFSVLRGGGIIGEHSVTFASENEILTLSHSARDRSLFANGALAAALWVKDRPPGLYDMQDVLGFSRG